MTKSLKQQQQKKGLMKKEIPATKTTGLMLGTLAIGGILTTSAITTTTAGSIC